MPSYVAKSTPQAGVYTTIGVIPNDMTINILINNLDPVNGITVRVGISPAAIAPLAIPNGDYVDPPDRFIAGGGKLELTGIAVQQGEVITGFNSAATVAWRAHGR